MGVGSRTGSCLFHYLLIPCLFSAHSLLTFCSFSAYFLLILCLILCLSSTPFRPPCSAFHQASLSFYSHLCISPYPTAAAWPENPSRSCRRKSFKPQPKESSGIGTLFHLLQSP